MARSHEIRATTHARSSLEPGFDGLRLLLFLGMALLHAMLAWTLMRTTEIAMYVDAERDGKLVVEAEFFEDLARDPERAVRRAAWDRTLTFGGDVEVHKAKLRAHLEESGPSGFVALAGGADLETIGAASSLPLTVGALFLVVWFAMMSLQGEGLDFDLQRRHHPMWEWLLSHPIRPGAAFFAEMLAPLAANPSFFVCPTFCFVLLAGVHPMEHAAVGAVLMGMPLAVAGSCASKLLEIWAVLRLSERSRGAVLGIASWFGFAAYLASVITIGHNELLDALVRMLQPIAVARPQLLPWLLGARADGSFSISLAVLSVWSVCAPLIAICVALSAVAVRRGLLSASSSPPAAPRLLHRPAVSRILRDPLWRKELLWLLRDRGALVQAFLIPLTFGAYQAWNLSGLTRMMAPAWNVYCAIGLICGTYFLIVLGPRSLMSEGAALWLTHTWPRGLESLFEAKARLWWILASLPVAALMALTVLWFPDAALKVALVAAGWWFFGQSLSRKMVTLVTVTSASGEPDTAPLGRRFAALLGVLAFGSGVATGNWHLAAIAVVFSGLAAAAMWEDFQARIPFLFDRWSERPPAAPTLLHSVVAIQGALEGAAVLAIFIALAMERKDMPTVFFIARGAGGLLALVIVDAFLRGRGVGMREIWTFAGVPAPSLDLGALAARLRSSLLIGASGAIGGACILAGVAILYTKVLHQIPALNDLLATPAVTPDSDPTRQLGFAFLAVIAAPISEEYLFRGLLFRGLERLWGGWRAVLWSALYFAIYHAPVSWPPVLLVGIFNALLFRHTRNLTPCVIAHACYNALVIGVG
jgi:membrane protease YdiL (CAAX protease family)